MNSLQVFGQEKREAREFSENIVKHFVSLENVCTHIYTFCSDWNTWALLSVQWQYQGQILILWTAQENPTLKKKERKKIISEFLTTSPYNCNASSGCLHFNLPKRLAIVLLTSSVHYFVHLRPCFWDFLEIILNKVYWWWASFVCPKHLYST